MAGESAGDGDGHGGASGRSQGLHHQGSKMGSVGGARKWDVFRLGNLLRMAVVWILCLIYSYIHYHVIRLRLPHRSQEFPSLDFLVRSLSHPKPACIVTGVRLHIL
jgi:hypothetical protein